MSALWPAFRPSTLVPPDQAITLRLPGVGAPPHMAESGVGNAVVPGVGEPPHMAESGLGSGVLPGVGEPPHMAESGLGNAVLPEVGEPIGSGSTPCRAVGPGSATGRPWNCGTPTLPILD